MNYRQTRLADEIRDIVAGLFLGGRLNDPRLEPVTITAVKLTPDLKIAYIYYRVYLGSSVEMAHVGLLRCSKRIRGAIGDGLRLRSVPDVRFFHDESIERGAKIETLLASVRQEQGTIL